MTVVGGSAGFVVVDAPGPGPGGAAPGRGLLTAVRRLGLGDLVGVVLTHGHEAHTAGSAELVAGLVAEQAVPVVVHESAAAALPTGVGSGEVRAVSSVTAFDLGDRVVEVVHPGRGHTDGDLVVRVPDAGVVVVGDLLAGDGLPAYGPECWPLGWPASLDLVLQLMGDGAGLALPGHGDLLTRAAAVEQRDGVATVAEVVRELAGRGVPEDRAPGQGEAEGAWPWPADRLAEAVRRGYAQLPRGARQLPLV
jgi:glyoxylase-like metal-dependent hydrolase (beta-lactamase superfamily II)